MTQPSNYNTYVIWLCQNERPGVLSNDVATYRFSSRKDATTAYQSMINDPATLWAQFTVIFANGVERITGRYTNLKS